MHACSAVVAVIWLDALLGMVIDQYLSADVRLGALLFDGLDSMVVTAYMPAARRVRLNERFNKPCRYGARWT